MKRKGIFSVIVLIAILAMVLAWVAPGCGPAAPAYGWLPGHSDRAGSVRPLAQNRRCPDHDLKGYPVV